MCIGTRQHAGRPGSAGINGRIGWKAALVAVAAGAMMVTAMPRAEAVSPRNPYRTFNLSGVNYGSMRWERAQRQGRRVWPYYNQPSRRYTTSRSRPMRVYSGGVVGGGVVTGGTTTIRETTPSGTVIVREK